MTAVDHSQRLPIAAAITAALWSGTLYAQQIPEQLSIAAGPQGSVNYAIATGVAAVASRHAGIKLVPVAYAGTSLSLPLVAQGDPPIGVNNGGSVYQGLVGEGEFNRAHPTLRMLSGGSPNNITAAVREDSPIKTGPEIRGKRVASGWAALPVCQIHATAILANYQLAWGDVRAVPVTNIITAARALSDGQVDALLCASPAIAALREAHSKSPLRFISIDAAPEAMARARAHYRYSEKAVMLRKGAIGWLPEDTWTLDYPWALFANEKLAEEAAYRVVKAIWEHNEELAQVHPILALWKPQRMVDPDMGVPYHPGAVRLYKEKGAWTAAAEAAQSGPRR